ncbi:hypothetical protein NPX13_g1055 [Xylaria arbuscula]|uniref:Uncharacterized protein n=1 Tax=Xylaria arbuscula TaxID=114810 RepID=A0A9W8NNF2_9PEZI|nr:hypothetical protein NPX13_g1055 [Xylaria arbuscula]
MEIPAPFPSNIFNGPHNNVYRHFCNQWVSGTELTMMVDAIGNRKDPEEQFLRRNTDTNPDDYMLYNINLGFTPSLEKQECTKGCMDAFSQISSDCKSVEGYDQFMRNNCSLAVDCGVFDYAITAIAAREVQERHCYGADDFGSHDDIHSRARGDPSTFISYHAYDRQQPVQMDIYWKDGCVLDSPSTDEIYPSNPLQLEDPGSTFCQNLLIENWEKCDNKGAGGKVQAGCLVYDFKATHA